MTEKKILEFIFIYWQRNIACTSSLLVQDDLRFLFFFGKKLTIGEGTLINNYLFIVVSVSTIIIK